MYVHNREEGGWMVGKLLVGKGGKLVVYPLTGMIVTPPANTTSDVQIHDQERHSSTCVKITPLK